MRRLSVVGNLRDEDGMGSLPDFSSKKTALKAHTTFSSRKSSSMGCSVLITLPSTEELLAAASRELSSAERGGANARRTSMQLLPDHMPLKRSITFSAIKRQSKLLSAARFMSGLSDDDKLAYVCSKPPRARTVADLECVLRCCRLNKYMQNLEASVRLQVTKVMGCERKEAGQRVMEQGEQGDKFYIIVRGAVGVEVWDGAFHGEGRLATALNLCEGASFGELALMSSEARRSASVTASRNCLLLTLGREDFEAVLAKTAQAKVIARAWQLMRSPLVQAHYSGSGATSTSSVAHLQTLIAKKWHERRCRKGELLELSATSVAYLTHGEAVVEDAATRLRIATLGEMSFYSPALAADTNRSDVAVALRLRARGDIEYLEMEMSDFSGVFSSSFAKQLVNDLRLQLVWWHRRVLEAAQRPPGGGGTQKTPTALPPLQSGTPAGSPLLATHQPRANLKRLKAQLPRLLRPAKAVATGSLGKPPSAATSRAWQQQQAGSAAPPPMSRRSARSAAFKSFLRGEGERDAATMESSPSLFAPGGGDGQLVPPARNSAIGGRLADKAWTKRSNAAVLPDKISMQMLMGPKQAGSSTRKQKMVAPESISNVHSLMREYGM